MRHVLRSAIRYAAGPLLVGAAISLPGHPRPALAADESASSRAEILRALHDVQSKYGADAVMIQGHLLAHAIRGGSVLEAVVSIPGVEDRAGKKFLAFRLETGIIYNDRDGNAPARTGRVWHDIVEATLRRFQTLTLPADGIALILGYTHKPYRDEAELRAHLDEGHGTAETAAFYLLLSDVTELIAERIAPQELLERSTVLVDGAPVHVVLDLPTPSP
jgi:hypothetical protein